MLPCGIPLLLARLVHLVQTKFHFIPSFDGSCRDLYPELKLPNVENIGVFITHF